MEQSRGTKKPEPRIWQRALQPSVEPSVLCNPNGTPGLETVVSLEKK